MLARLAKPLDARTSLIRKAKRKSRVSSFFESLFLLQYESALGNWICDLTRQQFGVILNQKVDLCLINAGSLRGDCLFSDPFTVEDLLTLLPFQDMTLGYRVRGDVIVEALEAGLAKHPAGSKAFFFYCLPNFVVNRKRRLSLHLRHAGSSAKEASGIAEAALGGRRATRERVCRGHKVVSCRRPRRLRVFEGSMHTLD